MTGVTSGPPLIEGTRRAESLDRRHPYLFVLLLVTVFVAVDLPLEATLSTLIVPYAILAVVAVLVVTRKHWWRATGFKSSGAGRRSLLLFVPAFLPVLWWVPIAPMLGYGLISIPTGAAALVALLGIALLIGFVEEVYFRGMMLAAIRSKGVWKAALVTALLFGSVHLENVFLGADPLSTGLQIGYATAIGLAFAAIVLVTGMVWPLVFAHALFDFVPNLNTAVVNATAVMQADYIFTAIIVLAYVPYAAVLLSRATRRMAFPTQ